MAKKKNGRVSKGDNGRHLETMGKAASRLINSGRATVSPRHGCWSAFQKEVESGRRQLKELGLLGSR